MTNFTNLVAMTAAISTSLRRVMALIWSNLTLGHNQQSLLVSTNVNYSTVGLSAGICKAYMVSWRI